MGGGEEGGSKRGIGWVGRGGWGQGGGDRREGWGRRRKEKEK